MKQRRLSIVSTSVAIAVVGLAVLSLAPVRQSCGEGYVTIRDGKISLINFVSIPDDSAPAATRTP